MNESLNEMVMINNLNISDRNSCTWKYVDDVLLSERAWEE